MPLSSVAYVNQHLLPTLLNPLNSGVFSTIKEVSDMATHLIKLLYRAHPKAIGNFIAQGAILVQGNNEGHMRSYVELLLDKATSNHNYNFWIRTNAIAILALLPNDLGTRNESWYRKHHIQQAELRNWAGIARKLRIAIRHEWQPQDQGTLTRIISTFNSQLLRRRTLVGAIKGGGKTLPRSLKIRHLLIPAFPVTRAVFGLLLRLKDAAPHISETGVWDQPQALSDPDTSVTEGAADVLWQHFLPLCASFSSGENRS